MTNAEKLAKDTERLALFLRAVYCSPFENLCKDCPIKGISCKNYTAIKEWLESEAQEDE